MKSKTTVRMIGLIAAIALITAGLFDNGYKDVMSKAVMICGFLCPLRIAAGAVAQNSGSKDKKEQSDKGFILSEIRDTDGFCGRNTGYKADAGILQIYLSGRYG